MNEHSQTLSAIGRLLSYPCNDYVAVADALSDALRGRVAAATTTLATFRDQIQGMTGVELEELYTRTFDVNPACALEVGWHLFGEEYARGLFLVRMRAELRRHELAESTELPDHLAHVLAVLAAMPFDEAREFLRACVLPAVVKMRRALEEQQNPYRNVIDTLLHVFQHDFELTGTFEEMMDNAEHAESTADTGGDPLQDYPVLLPSDGEATLVPLHINYRDAFGIAVSTYAPENGSDLLDEGGCGHGPRV
jgi:nitrate reductase delta subunit